MLYNEQFPALNSDNSPILCRSRNNQDGNNDNDYLNIVSLAYHDGESHHFSLDWLLLESGDISYNSDTQINDYASGYKELNTRSNTYENYKISTNVEKEESDYLRCLAYATHCGGEQFIVNAKYSLQETSSGVPIARITNYQQTLLVQDRSNGYQVNLELASKGASNLSKIGTLKKFNDVNTSICTGMAKIENNPIFTYDCLLMTQVSSDVQDEEDVVFYDTLYGNQTSKIHSFPRIIGSNIFWAFIIVNKYSVLFVDSDNLAYFWDLRTNENYTPVQLPTVYSIVRLQNAYLLATNAGLTLLYVDNRTVYTSLLSQINISYLVEDLLNKKVIGIDNTNGNIYTFAENDINLSVKGNLGYSGTTSMTVYHNTLITSDVNQIYIHDLYNWELLKTKTIAFNHLGPLTIEIPQFMIVVRGTVLISSPLDTGNDLISFVSINDENEINEFFYSFYLSNRGHFIFADEKLYVNTGFNGLYSLEPYLTIVNRTTAITSGVFFHDGTDWKLSYDFDDCLDLSVFDQQSFPIDYLTGFTFNDNGVEKPLLDISYSPDAQQQTVDLEPDTFQFKISNRIIPPTITSGGVLSDYPVISFYLDRRYSGYQVGNNPHIRFSYGIRGTISDASQGAKAKTEIDLIDKNLTEVSVVSDIVSLHRNNDVRTQGTCRWLFGNLPCSYVPKVLEFIIADVSFGDGARLFTFEVNSQLNPNEFLEFSTFDPLLFRYGTVEFLSGANKNYIIPIKKVSNDSNSLTITLLFGSPFSFDLGLDTVKLTQGCNKSFNQCLDYGQNMNFGGMPYIPGNGIFVRGTNYKTSN